MFLIELYLLNLFISLFTVDINVYFIYIYDIVTYTRMHILAII